MPSAFKTVAVVGKSDAASLPDVLDQLVSLLRAGETRVTTPDGDVRRYATDDGYLQVRRNHALVLVSDAVSSDSIDVGEAQRRLEEAQAELERASAGDGDVDAARRAVDFAEALVKTASG